MAGFDLSAALAQVGVRSFGFQYALASTAFQPLLASLLDTFLLSRPPIQSLTNATNQLRFATQAIKHPRRDVLTRKSQLLSAPQRLAEWRTADLAPDSVLDAATGAYARCPIQ